MTDDPLPDTPAHQVLMNVAFGDHQVTDYQADVEARTIGARAHRPVLFPGRWPDTDVLWGVPAIRRYPYTGSAIYYWDTGPIREDPAPGHRRRHRTAALREPAQPQRRRPPRRAAGDPGRAAARLGLLRRGDPGKRQLRRRPLLRDRVQRALARRLAELGDQIAEVERGGEHVEFAVSSWCQASRGRSQ